ncbi:hypothetical protein FG386_002394 [Cryptosporidium ryanae]|uniref:uncharacterized protein n=1 Tax=Cryptosporidium ryanae TaxID=515981 RepID=UPI003519E1F8|nr:hypothetical protein FG386_002394 [Cryptosporidium ryanae]
MSRDNKDLMLCGVYECNYTSKSGEIKHITPTQDYYEKFNIREESTKVLLPYYIDVNFDGISQFETQSHIVLRFNNMSDNVMAKLKKMYIIHEGIPVQLHNLNCFLIGKNSKIDDSSRLSLLGSSMIKDKVQYFKSIRVVIKIDNPINNLGDNGIENNMQTIRIMIDYIIDLDNLMLSFHQTKNKNHAIESYLKNESLDEESSDVDSQDYSFVPILMPTMGHR